MWSVGTDVATGLRQLRMATVGHGRRMSARTPGPSDQIAAARSQGEAAQADVIAFLSDPATYGNSGQVQCITTHAARIFLAGDLAYKVKRAVKYPYLDYSTLDQRRRICEREFAINKPNAPDLYTLASSPWRGRTDGSSSMVLASPWNGHCACDGSQRERSCRSSYGMQVASMIACLTIWRP